uniref:Uncharacterized protein n=1 Tax=Trypanosoma congolense (strain IL3000) TaxID=1068625 RepID=G0UP05_TRYCI|nr:conserved hypothetical protein [Trypanosoma congolense IL3000]
MNRLGFTFLIFLCGVSSAVVGQDVNCGTGEACQPWLDDGTSSRCYLNGRINLRFLVDTPSDVRDEVSGPVWAAYGFCPFVDNLQLFRLTGAAAASSIVTKEISNETIETISSSTKPRYISVFGFGRSDSKEYPEKGVSNGTAVVSVLGNSVCKDPNSVAVVNMLMLSIGMHNGAFNYIQPNTVDRGNSSSTEEGKDSKASDGHEEAGKVPVQPMMVGFRPTCDEVDRCILSPGSVCIGDEPGRKNCGVCHTSTDTLEKAVIQVWTSYFGTDANGASLLSGGMDPLSYKRFAGSRLVSDLKSIVSGIQDTLGTLKELSGSQESNSTNH